VVSGIEHNDTEGPDAVAPSFRFWLEEFAGKPEDDPFSVPKADGCLMSAVEIALD
jgi:hypothetical protein